MDGKGVTTSRFSTLRVFKFTNASKPLPPPPKNAAGPYSITPYTASTHTASTSQITLHSVPNSSQDLSLTPSASPNGDNSRFLHPPSPLSLEYPTANSSPRNSPQATTFKKGFFSFGKGPKRSQTAPPVQHSPSPSDMSISGPWNFQHHVHINGELRDLPPSWSASVGESELAALRSRHRLYPQSNNPPHFATIGHPYASSAPLASSSTPMVITPKPRSDSLRRTAANHPVKSAASAPPPTISPASAALKLVRHPIAPGNVAASSHPPSSMRTLPADSSPKRSPAASPIDSPTQSLSQTSSRSPPPAPLDLRPLRPLRVMNDPDLVSLVSPPPAYKAAASPFRSHARESVDKSMRYDNIEKPPLPQPDSSSRAPEVLPEPEPDLRMEDQSELRMEEALGLQMEDQSDLQMEEQSELQMEEVSELQMEEESELEEEPEMEEEPEPEIEDEPQSEEQPEEDELSESEPEQEDVAPLASQARMSAFPPRLSLRAHQEDDWADMFSFLPSRDSTVSRRSSIASPSKRTSITGKRDSVQAKRRSKSFPNGLPALILDNSRLASSPIPDAEADSRTTVYVSARRDSGADIFTPDPAYPIANSPLWEEVRTLVRKGTQERERGEDQSVSDPKPERASLAPPSPGPSSRFSDMTAVPDDASASRFSDATSFQGHSRFSEATSFQGHSRFSEASVLSENDSRFSAWSLAGQAPLSTLFTPMETMPESPPIENVDEAPQPPAHPVVRKPSDRGLPPQPPPPKESLPPPPSPEEEEEDVNADESRVSHISDRSSVLIHGARTATRNILPLAQAVSISLSSRKSSPASASPPAQGSSQNGRPPPLPLPPTGKVLPSLIMQERRKQRSEDDSAPRSASSSSHSRATSNDSGILFDSSRNLSVSVLSSYEEQPVSPMFGYIGDGSPRSPKSSPGEDVSLPDNQQTVIVQHNEVDEDEDDTVPLAHLRREQVLKTWDEDATEIPVKEKPALETLELEASVISESPSVYDSSPPSATGAVFPARAAPASEAVSTPDVAAEKHAELPLTLTPLREYIFVDFDPVKMFVNLQEVAQGQYGSVYAAQVAEDGAADSTVAVKKVPVSADGTPKIVQLRHELGLMSQVRHKHILATDGLFFDPGESMLWIRMELMERSLADVLELNQSGLVLQEQVMARFTCDVLLALAYLYELGLAHRDVRSDNILIDSEGVVKLADFSTAVRVSRQDPFHSDIVGVHHWQAPEIRSGRYDASLVDVWSLGATCWEMAESVPPFADVEDMRELSDRWPPLSRTEAFSPHFHDFLRLCSEPLASRPPASQLLQHQFIQQASPRDDILQVLHLCRQIEESFR